MATKDVTRITFNSIPQMYRALGLGEPAHPLIAVVDSSNVKDMAANGAVSVVTNFYSIYISNDFTGKVKYGQGYYDFSNGVMFFTAPGQVSEMDSGVEASGQWLLVHPDFLQGYALAKNIKDFGYFSYSSNEALFLTDDEKAIVLNVVTSIEKECQKFDSFSHDVLISHVEVLLNYSNRFYYRQFIAQPKSQNNLLSQLEDLLAVYFKSDEVQQLGLPSVNYISSKLNFTPNYLSDVLRALTGQGTQQHIHNILIEKAKELLSTTRLSAAEVGYKLGFEHPQSFSKLFKNKTGTTPLEFRSSFA